MWRRSSSRFGKPRSGARPNRAQRAERVLAPLLAADAPAIDQPVAFGRYRWRIAREILALRGDRESALPFAAGRDNPPRPDKLGPNLVDNPSFEDPPQADGSPRGRYNLGYPKAKEKPIGASERNRRSRPLRPFLAEVGPQQSSRRGIREQGTSLAHRQRGIFERHREEFARQTRQGRILVQTWRRHDGPRPGSSPQPPRKGRGRLFYYRGGVDDPAVWNHFQTEGRLSNDLESMDIHTWCTIPEAELAKKCFFYIDDVSLEVIEEPPLVISTPLDEYYSGESILWLVNSTSSSGAIKIALLAGERVVAQHSAQGGFGPLSGVFAGHWPNPGIYTLQATATAPQQAPLTAQRQVIVAPDPFGW